MVSEEQRQIELEKIRNTPPFWERVVDIIQELCTHPKEFEQWIPEAAGGGTECGICHKTLY